VPESGDLIGPYRFISQLGRGAMGEVWRARDERLDRYVALKVLPSELADDVERRARMIREARAAAAIRHANVVTLFDIVTHEGDDILVMELVEGRTLSDALRKDGAPALELGLRWIEGVADALVAAHARGILHRDIKAANIMVTPDGVKVLDFGLAKLREDGASPISGIRPPAVSTTKIALDATMASEPGSSLSETLPTTPIPSRATPTKLEIDSYRTHAGQLLGTPLYMAPEQIDGALPDERSEVFSIGVLAHEILAGKPPYTAVSMDVLFTQITKDAPPALPDRVPDAVGEIVTRALAKDPAQRFPTMQSFRDAIAAQRHRLFAPPARRWPLVVAGVVVLGTLAAGLYLWLRTPDVTPSRPGDEYVKRALEEYDVFYNDKALSSLRAALAVAPRHPRALAYTALFGGASDADRTRAVEVARIARPATRERSKDRALLDAAVALSEQGPHAAREALAAAGAARDRELAFWTAELDYRAGDYALARDEYAALLAEPTPALRGRIYDHQTAVLLYLDEPAEALRIGTLYRDAFPGEADALGVHATTLAAAGDYPLERAGPARRPLRRAALALLTFLDGDIAAAQQLVAPCLAGGADSGARERGACLFVAGVIDPAHAEAIARELDGLVAAATPARPAYGAPASLAGLVRARARFFGGGCFRTGDGVNSDNSGREIDQLVAAYTAPLDFYAAYHVPFFATWAMCERAALVAASGDRAGAIKLLEPVATRAPNRTWLLARLARYRE